MIALPPTVPSALATAQLGLRTAFTFSHSSELTAIISQELTTGQALLPSSQKSWRWGWSFFLLQVRKLRLREVMKLDQGNAASRRAVNFAQKHVRGGGSIVGQLERAQGCRAPDSLWLIRPRQVSSCYRRGLTSPTQLLHRIFVRAR